MVNIPLSRIETNEELFNLFFDLSFSVKGEDLPVKLQYSDIIFVMEDIDCASRVVHARKPAKSRSTTVVKTIVEGAKKDGKKVIREVSTQQDEDAYSDDDDTKEEKLFEGMAMASLLGGGGTKTNDATGETVQGPKLKMQSKSDKLSLSGILNVLDGVVDSPGRILIMTSNHPEKLDPALIRPGRVDIKLKLDYMGANQICQLVELYFQRKLEPEERSRIHNICGCPLFKNATGAQLEQLAVAHDTVADFTKALQTHFCAQCF